MTCTTTYRRLAKPITIGLAIAAIAAPGAQADTGLCPFSYAAPPGGGTCPVLSVDTAHGYSFDGPRAAGPQGWQIGAYSHDGPRSGPATSLSTFSIDGPRSGPATVLVTTPTTQPTTGFNWGDAGIGAGIGAAIGLALGSAGLALTRRRRPLAGI
jgi:hypothetical protein